MISSIFKNMNLKVGTYTSPHLIKFNERIRVNNIEISDEYICSFIEQNERKIKQIKSTFLRQLQQWLFHILMIRKLMLLLLRQAWR